MIWHDLGVVIRVNWKIVNPKNKKVLAKHAGKHLIANAMNIHISIQMKTTFNV